MSRTQIVAVTAALMLSLFLASMEATVVSTAMPTIVSQLSGLELYSWVFSAYSLTSTTTVPIYGKLSDIYGRRVVFLVALAIFIVGSIVAGSALTMTQLILARALQGLGAGGVLPLVFVMIGDMFSLEQRARFQGLFSGVWGVSSIVGPLLGGFLVDRVSWHWVFFINVPPALFAAALFIYGWREPRPETRRTTGKVVRLDIAGAVLLMAAVTVLLLGLFDINTSTGWILIGLAAALLVVLVVVERRAADPMLPIHLFRDRLFLVACLHGVLVGTAIFGTASFVPLFAQTVLGTTATAAGAMLTPQLLCWVLASIIASRLLLRVSYRTMASLGMAIAVCGTALVLSSTMLRSALPLLVGMGLAGTGMGMCIPSFQLAVQSAVPRRSLGTATSTLTFSRNIGGTLGVSIMGALLTFGLAASLSSMGILEGVSVDSLLDPAASGASGSPLANPMVVSALAQALQGVFLFSVVMTVTALGASLLAPRGNVQQLENQRDALAKAEADLETQAAAAESSFL